MLPGQANFLQSLGWALLNSLWQMALLWIIYQVISGIFKSARSSFRSSLACILLITGFALFIFTFVSFYRNLDSSQAFFSFSILQEKRNFQLNNWLQQILPVASVVYLFLLLFPVAHFIRNYRYVQVIRQYGLTKVDVQWRVFVKKVTARMGIKKPVHIWVSEFVSSPVTIGFLKPVILVPLAAINHLSSRQMEAVLLHELSHIRRYDYLVNLIINLIQTILYFNPFVKSFVKTLENEREKSCDEMVLQFQYDSFEYAAALLTLEKNNHIYKPLAIGITGKKNNLLQRVELIMGVHAKSAISFNRIAGLLAGLIFIFALNEILMIKKQTGEKTTGSFSSLATPFNYFTNNISEPADKPVPQEQKTEHTSINIREAVAQPDIENPENNLTSISSYPGVIDVAYIPVKEVQLKKYQEAQVKAAMDASKKVLESVELKSLEINIADVFTQKEKEELKATYRKAMDKMDWNKWENKLRLAYDKVDWNRVNEQLSKAVNNIRVDSLQKVYTEAICKLNDAKKGLEINLKDLMDSNITADVLDQKKQELQNTLDKLKSRKAKKIVHL